jgi:peroxiredoxin
MLPSSNTSIFMFIVIAFIALLVAPGQKSAWSMGERPPAVGNTATDFSLPDLDGRQVRLSDYRGKMVLLNFWATWCKPCTTEMPAMQAAYDKLRDQGLVVLAVNELEDTGKVRQHIETYGHTFPVLMDRNNKVANMFGVFGLPVTVFIDQNGVVQEYIKGGLLTEEKIHAVVSRLSEATSRTASAR